MIKCQNSVYVTSLCYYDQVSESSLTNVMFSLNMQFYYGSLVLILISFFSVLPTLRIRVIVMTTQTLTIILLVIYLNFSGNFKEIVSEYQDN